MLQIQCSMTKISEFLTQKYLDWQAEEGESKTIEEYAVRFGASRPLVSAWMSGQRPVTEKYKQRIIDLYGDEAVIAFGDDPVIYALRKHWDLYTPEERRKMRAEVEDKKAKHEAERSHTKPRTRKAD